MKNLLLGVLMAASLAANAGIWEGVKAENHVSGPEIAEKDLLGKVVVAFYVGGTDMAQTRAERAEKLWKSHDKKRFIMVGSVAETDNGAAATIKKQKISFPCYKGFKLATETAHHEGGEMVVVDQYGKVVVVLGPHGGAERDFETFLVEAITDVGQPPSLAKGVTLNKYKALKTKIKLGVNMKGVIKQLEKESEAGDKKTATQAIKDKADEATNILSAIRDNKAEIYSNITALAEINPEQALALLTQYLKSFPEELADNKDKLAELKVKAAEFKKANK